MRWQTLSLPGLTLGVACAMTLTGCEMDPAVAQRDVAAAPVESTAAPPATDPAAAAVQAHADRLAAAATWQTPPIPADRSAMPPVANEVMWLTPGATDDAAASPAQPEPVAASPVEPAFTSAANTITVVDAEPLDLALPDTPPAEDAAVAPVLFARIADDSATDFDKALRAVAVTLADPAAPLDSRYFAPLTPEQEHAVRLYHDLMLTMRTQLVEDDGKLDRDVFTTRLSELFGQQPISIRDLRLCRRVSGYGVYEPFDSTTFLAGREQPMIVYVELDDFAALDRGDGRYVVDLQQDVTLYASDGLAVWRHEPVHIEDISANRRRDFFVVQLVKLPARLSVGKYRLKVRVTDLNGGSIDERGLDLDVVADRALVEKPAQESAPLQ